MFKATQFKMPKAPAPQEKVLNRIDGGINTKYVESLIDDTQSPDMLNLNCDDRGALTKRMGQVIVHTFPLTPVYAQIYWGTAWIAHAGTKLYSWNPDTDVEAELLTGLAENKGKFFTFSDKLLYKNNGDYIHYDGSTCEQVDANAYVPTLTQGRKPDGTDSTDKEEFNLLTPYFKDGFKGDGSSTAYTLSLTGLDADNLVASIDFGATFNQAEGVAFSVNRTTGIVTWNVAPPDGTSYTDDNVIIKAAKTISGFKDRVKKCTKVELYGGATNDTRIFMADAEGYANVYRYTGLTGNTAWDYRYFPENSFNRIGSDAEHITGFSKYFGMLVIPKEDSTFSIQYQYNSTTGTSTFPVKSMNGKIGCNMPGSIQIIGDSPVFFHMEKGGYLIHQTLIENEKSFKPISANVDGSTFRAGILDEAESDLADCSSIDFGGKYWLCVGSKVWVWDYKLSPYPNGQTDDTLKWFPYDNINANSFATHDRELYYGSRTTGALVKFIEEYNDFGSGITARWKSKLFDFDFFHWLKTVIQVAIKTRSGNNSVITLNFYDDNNVLIDTQTINTVSFSWATFAWNTFSWAVYRFPKVFVKKVKQKNIIHWQIEITNSTVNKNLSIMGLVVTFTLDRKVK